MSNVAGLLRGWKGVLTILFLLLGISSSDGIAFAGLPADKEAAASPGSKRAVSAQDFEPAYNRYDGQASPTPIPGCGLYWRIVDSPNVGENSDTLQDVAVVTATDVWAVGFYFNSDGIRKTLTLHWDGSQWSNVPSPNAGASVEENMLTGVSAVSSNDVWAVGFHWTNNVTEPKDVILHWDGNLWSVVEGPSTTWDVELYDVVAISHNDVWAVGGSGGLSLTTHWNGTTWSNVPSPSDGKYTRFTSVSAISSTDVWAAGYSGVGFGTSARIMHWDGQAWTQVSTPNTFTDSTLYGIKAIAPNDVWAVGDYSQNWLDYLTLTLHWDGTSWSHVPSPNGGEDSFLTAVSAVSSSDVWAVGYYRDEDLSADQTISIRWNGSTWTRVASPNSQTDSNYFFGVAAVSSGDVWAIGHYGGSIVLGGYTLVERYSDPCASPTNTPVTSGTVVVTGTPVLTSTPTITRTPTDTPTGTATNISTETPTCAATNTPANTATSAATSTWTNTSTPTPTICTASFTDVPQLNTFYVHVRCLACKGILGGYSDGSFRPNNDITRGQLSKIIANSAGFGEPVSGQTFQDVLPGSTFYAFIERMAARGIIGGYACDGTGEPCGASNKPYFRPNANATRGQISKIVSEAKGYSEPPGSRVFEDVPPGSAFYEWVQRLTYRGIMGGYPCGGPGEPCGSGNRPYFRPNNNATRGQSSKIVANTFFPNCNPPARR
jgi:hypothetical protein